MILLLAAADASADTAVPPPRVCDDKPVLMVVNGPTHDRPKRHLRPARRLLSQLAAADRNLRRRAAEEPDHIDRPLPVPRERRGLLVVEAAPGDGTADAAQSVGWRLCRDRLSRDPGAPGTVGSSAYTRKFDGSKEERIK